MNNIKNSYYLPLIRVQPHTGLLHANARQVLAQLHTLVEERALGGGADNLVRL